MANTLEMTTSTLSVCSNLFGFYSPDVIANKKFRYIVIAYCCLLTVLCITYFVLFNTAFLESSRFSFHNATHELAEIVRTTMLTYYVVKFIVEADAVNGILENISYADKCLERIGVVVRHTVQRVTFAVTIIFLFAVRTMIAISAWKKSPNKTVISKQYSTYYFIGRVAVNFSTEILLFHCVFILFIVKQRMSRFRCAAEKIEYIFARKFAWDSSVTLSVEDTPREGTSANRRENYLIEIYKLNKCMLETFEGITNFYNRYFLFNLLFYILKLSVVLFMHTVRKTPIYSACLAVFYTLFTVASLALYVKIRLEFHTVEILMNKFYWSNKFKRFNVGCVNVTKWSIQRSHRLQTGNCGYFDVDLNVLATVFEFLLLFLFAM